MSEITVKPASILFQIRNETILFKPYGPDTIRVRASRNDDQAGGYAPAPSAPAPMAQNSGFTAVETDDLPF